MKPKIIYPFVLLVTLSHIYYLFVSFYCARQVSPAYSALEIRRIYMDCYDKWFFGQPYYIIPFIPALLGVPALFFLYWQILEKKRKTLLNITALVFLHLSTMLMFWHLM